MPYFDDLFVAADAVLDSVFAGPACFRANGLEMLITASVRSHAVGTDGDRTAAETWIGYAVECHASDLEIEGQYHRPIAGEEFAFPLPDGGSKVFKVVIGPNGRCYEPLDTINTKLLVFCKFNRDDPTT